MDWFMAPLLAFLASAPIRRVDGSEGPKERRPAVAGSFYPADPVRLSSMIDGMLAQAAPQPTDGPVLAAVAPHAGYPYSGPVAAWTYAALKGHRYDRVVVIAPSHFEAFGFSSVYDGDAFLTPLGTIPVDRQFAQQLAGTDSTIRLAEQGHTPMAAGGEHAIEVQLPWLQKVLGSFSLVPIVMGDQSYQSSRALGRALAKVIQTEDSRNSPPGGTLILASSDLSHYHPYAEAESIDRKTLGALAAWDYFSMSRNFQKRTWEACGGAPIVAAMIAAERMGANKADVLRYGNSGDTGGDRSRVVGYSAAVFVKTGQGAAQEAPFSVSSEQKAELLALARNSAQHAVQTHSAYDPPPVADEALLQEYGAFVTLTEAGSLRGCIGYTTPVRPLYLTVCDAAAHAALHDPRFRPVSPAELSRLHFEISVLSPLRHVTDIEQIQVGRDGLLIKNGDNEGLLLPQVPVELKWDHQTFLEHTCLKAGLSSNRWKDDNTDIFKFTAVVFGERDTAIRAERSHTSD